MSASLIREIYLNIFVFKKIQFHAVYLYNKVLVYLCTYSWYLILKTVLRVSKCRGPADYDDDFPFEWHVLTKHLRSLYFHGVPPCKLGAFTVRGVNNITSF